MKITQITTLLFLSVFVLSPFFSLANKEWDDDEVRTYDVENFQRVVLEGGYKVILEQSGKPGLRIKADEESFEYIDVDSDNGTLHVELKEKHFNFEGMILYIEFEQLESLKIEGGVKLETKGYLDLNDFYLSVEGGAKIEMEMKAEEVHLQGEGGVSYTFRGVARKMDVRLSGAGHLNANDFKTEEVAIDIEGVGGASVYATKYLKAQIEGVGKIRYRGNPQIDKNIEGIGFVRPD